MAGGLLLMPKLRVSSRQRRRLQGRTTKNSANEVSRSNSFKFERYQAAASPEGAEADSARRDEAALQRKVGRRPTNATALKYSGISRYANYTRSQCWQVREWRAAIFLSPVINV